MNKIALVCNVLIDSKIKYEFFCLNFSEINELFTEFHLKIRGKYSDMIIENCNKIIKNKNVYYYQNLSGKSYREDMKIMVKQVESETIFLFFEDFKLMCGIEKLKEVLNDFTSNSIDYMPYVGKISRGILSVENILPLKPMYKENMGIIDIETKSLKIMRKILITNYIFTLPSVVSKNYLNSILQLHNNIRIYINVNILNSILLRIIGWPKNINFIHKINNFIRFFKINLCTNPINSPHDLELMAITGMPNGVNRIKIGLSKFELFSNWDDDYGIYGTSLIQRGLFPYGKLSDELFYGNNKTDVIVKWEVILNPGDVYNIQYHNRNGRINSIPVLRLKVSAGLCLHTNIEGDKILELNVDYYFLTSQKQSIINKSCDIAVLSLSMNEI